LGFLKSRIIILSVEHSPRTVTLYPTDLDERRVNWHDDGGWNSKPLAVERYGHAVVSRARRNDAAFRLSTGKRQKAIQRPSFLKGAGHLQVIQLEEDAVSRHLAYGLRIGTGRAVDAALNAPPRGLDIFQGDHGIEIEPDPRRGQELIWRVSFAGREISFRVGSG